MSCSLGRREKPRRGLRACKRCCPDLFYVGRDPDCERLIAVLSAVEQDPSAFPDVAALADRVGFGLSKLYTIAQRCLGTTPSEMIHATRLRVAIRLLSERQVGATEVAFAVGYGSEFKWDSMRIHLVGFATRLKQEP